MTVSYTVDVATAHYSAFLKLLFRWKGSVYRFIWFELLIFATLYTILSLVYRLALNEAQKRMFEHLCLRCESVSELVPIGFVLGFYVDTVVRRWWDQFCAIPWPDGLTLLVNAYAKSLTERGRMQRRTLIRYINLAFALTTRDISSRARLRFPTLDHLISAGLMTPEELSIYETSGSDTVGPMNFLPLCWAENIAVEMEREKSIVFNRAVELITAEIGFYRDKLYQLVIYDWINVPLVYTQVATAIVYSYFMFSLLGWQFLDPNRNYRNVNVDFYVPIFGLLRFLFYMGWLKVAESLINPFGEDADDFEIEEYIERNVQFTNFWERAYGGEIPPVVQDPYWDADDLSLPQKVSLAEDGGQGVWQTQTSVADDPFQGSLADMDFADRRRMSVFVR